MCTYDLICVGGGIANLSLAYTYLKKCPDRKVLILEKGPGIKTRLCPKLKTGYCVNCKPCRITAGFGGAGCFSDCKLTYSKDVGGTLSDYVGEEKFIELQQSARNFFSDLGANAPTHFDIDYFEDLDRHCKELDLKLVKSEVQHLGTEGSYALMSELFDRLTQMGCEILCDTIVTNDINFKDNELFYYDKKLSEHIVKYDKLSIAVGRGGSEWLDCVCSTNGIRREQNTIDIGVRVEVPSIICKDITDHLYEMKIVNKITDHSSVRTFCVNPQGYVTEEHYEDVACVNGHSFASTKSDNTNFALLHAIRFTEPFNNPTKYGKSICKLANELGGGKILVQRLGDIKSNRRTTGERLSSNTVKPTLKDIVGGDLGYVIPTKSLTAIVNTLEKLDKIIPGLYSDDTLLYAPEVKFYSSKIKLNDKLQVDNKSDLNNVYFLGDSSGVTHGIIQSCMSGIYVAEQLCQ